MHIYHIIIIGVCMSLSRSKNRCLYSSHKSRGYVALLVRTLKRDHNI